MRLMRYLDEWLPREGKREMCSVVAFAALSSTVELLYCTVL